MRRRLFAFALFIFAFPAAVLAQEIEGDGKPSPAWDRPPLPDMALGPADARVTVIEYASASCPHCAEFHISHFGALKAAYINKGKIRFVLREYPHNDAAVGAFMLARCAPPGRYFDYLDRFFTTQDRWTNAPREGLAAIALELGIAQSDFERCMADEKLAKAIAEGRNLARSHGVETVPTFYIDGELHTGDKTYEALSAEIDKRLGK